MPYPEQPSSRRRIPTALLVVGATVVFLVILLLVRIAYNQGVDAAATAASAPQAGESSSTPPAPAVSSTAAAPADTPQPEGQTASGPAEATLVPVVTAGELAANPALYYGRLVSVHAEIDEVLGPRSFTLDEDRLGTSPDVLVLVPSAAPDAAPAADAYVTVTGRVRPFVESTLTRTFDWFQPADDVLVRVRARPVIIAERAKLADGTMLSKSDTPPSILVTNAGRVGSVPGRFYGQRVLLPDATVDTVHSPRAFTLDDPAYLAEDDLLVVLPPKSKARVTADEVVSVRGTVRRYSAGDFERDYDWFDAGDFDALRSWENRPVLVADFMRQEGGVELVLIEHLDWTSRTRLDGEDWWVQQAWEPLPRGRSDADASRSEGTVVDPAAAAGRAEPADAGGSTGVGGRRAGSAGGRRQPADAGPVGGRRSPCVFRRRHPTSRPGPTR